MKYNIADEVRVRPDLVSEKDYGSMTYCDSWGCKGKMGKIIDVDDSDGTYLVKFHNKDLWLSEEMLTNIVNFTVGDVVKIHDNIIERDDDTVGITPMMEQDFGKTATITRIADDGTCVLQVNGGTTHYWWQFDWIEPYTPSHVEMVRNPIRTKVAVKFYNEITENHDTIKGVVLRDTFDDLTRWVFEDANGNLYVMNYDTIDYVLPYEGVE